MYCQGYFNRIATGTFIACLTLTRSLANFVNYLVCGFFVCARAYTGNACSDNTCAFVVPFVCMLTFLRVCNFFSSMYLCWFMMDSPLAFMSSAFTASQTRCALADNTDLTELEVPGQTKLEFEARGHVRRLFGCALDRDFVHGALVFNGYDVQTTTHKSDLPWQSHGRWQVRGSFFEVFLGYKNNKRGPLVDTVIRGLKGKWSAQELDQVALLLTDAISDKTSAVADAPVQYFRYRR